MKRVVAAIQDIIDEGVASEWEREHGRPVTGGSCSCFGR